MPKTKRHKVKKLRHCETLLPVVSTSGQVNFQFTYRSCNFDKGLLKEFTKITNSSNSSNGNNV